VAIARALALKPPVLLADEPTAHLDPVQFAEVMKLVRTLTTDDRIVIVSTHDERLVAMADQIVELVPKRRGELHTVWSSEAGSLLLPAETGVVLGDRGSTVDEDEAVPSEWVDEVSLPASSAPSQSPRGPDAAPDGKGDSLPVPRPAAVHESSWVLKKIRLTGNYAELGPIGVRDSARQPTITSTPLAGAGRSTSTRVDASETLEDCLVAVTAPEFHAPPGAEPEVEPQLESLAFPMAGPRDQRGRLNNSHADPVGS